MKREYKITTTIEEQNTIKDILTTLGVKILQLSARDRITQQESELLAKSVLKLDVIHTRISCEINDQDKNLLYK